MYLQIYTTKQLTETIKNEFNKVWSSARGKEEDIFTETLIKDQDIYFLYFDPKENEAISIGRYRYITGVIIGRKTWEYPIWGRSNIATNPKYQGKGFGKKIVKAMNNYALKNKLWVIGFHGKSTGLSNFYRKCGLEIDSDLGKRIFFPKKGTIVNHKNSCVSYFKGDPFIRKLKTKKDDEVYLPYSW